MPRDYWAWWWIGLLILLGLSTATNAATTTSAPVTWANGTGLAIWAALIAVGWRRNRDAPKTFPFWWSLAAFGSYLLFGIAVTFNTPTGIGLTVVAIWATIWIIGGIAVIIIWLIHKARAKDGPVAADKACPYCAETIKGDAIKCRFCGEALEPAATRGPASLVEESSDEGRQHGTQGTT